MIWSSFWNEGSCNFCKWKPVWSSWVWRKCVCIYTGTRRNFFTLHTLRCKEENLVKLFPFLETQANNAYIFPGFGLGLVISGAIRVHDDMLLAAGNCFKCLKISERSKVSKSYSKSLLVCWCVIIYSWGISWTSKQRELWERNDISFLLLHPQNISSYRSQCSN